MKYLKTWALALFIFCGVIETATAQNWPSLDAVVYNNISDKYYFFYGKYCVIKERGKYIDGLPLLITDEWEGFPQSWNGGNIDAVCFVSDVMSQVGMLGAQQKGTYWFFKGDEVCSKVMGERMSSPFKLNSKAGFQGIPWNSVDAVTFNTSSQTYYFFKGNEYVSKKKGEAVSTTKVRTDSKEGFINIGGDRPIKAVDFSQDNREYYFFWDSYYMTKVMGKDIPAGTQPRRYENDGQSGFKWAERSANNFIGLANEAGYLSNFYVSWESGGRNESWSKKGVALTYEKLVKLPMDARNIKISCRVYDEFGRDKNGPYVFNESMNIPPNKWYKVYGTVFEPKWKTEKNSTNILGSVENFFNQDIGKAFESAMEQVNNAMNDAQYAIVKQMAKSDASKYSSIISKLGTAAQSLVRNDPGFVDGLLRAARDKSAARNGEFVKRLLSRPEMAEIVRASGFETLSVGFTSGASAVIGTEGAFGYAVSFNGSQVLGFAGLDGSIGVQSGVGAGAQFGIWQGPPSGMEGSGAAVSIEVGSGAGVSFSIAYNIEIVNNAPNFTFAGIVVTPSVGAGVGGSVSSGYSWVY